MFEEFQQGHSEREFREAMRANPAIQKLVYAAVREAGKELSIAAITVAQRLVDLSNSYEEFVEGDGDHMKGEVAAIMLLLGLANATDPIDDAMRKLKAVMDAAAAAND